MVNNYNEYLLELLVESIKNKETRLYLSNNLKSILNDIDKDYNNNISIHLLQNNDYEKFNTKITYIDLDDSGMDMVSFITVPKSSDLIIKDRGYDEDTKLHNIDYKTYTYDDSIVYQKNRTKIKIGKLIKKLFGDEFENSGKPGEDIETFVNIFKSYRDISKFEIVSGNDLNYWYNEEQYSDGEGTLNNSCMRYESCEDYIDFYSKNGVKMLILKDRQDDNKIRGRALIWELDKPSGRTFMDRIYTILDSDVQLFIQYAKENKWLHKKHQNSSSSGHIIDTIDNSEKYLDMEVWGIESTGEYPYIDTLCYYYHEDDMLSNSSSKGNYYELNDTNGDYSDEQSGIYVEYYGESYDEDDLTWCEMGDDWRLDGDYFWSDRYRCHVAQDYADDNMIYCEYGDEHVESGDEIDVRDGGYMVEDYDGDDITYCEYSDEYIKTRYAVWSDWHNSYLHRDDAIEVYTDDRQHNTDWRPDNDSSSYYEHTDGEYYDNGVEIEDEDEDEDE